MTTISATAFRHLPYRCDAVYEAALHTPPTSLDTPTELLGARHIWGSRDAVGCQTLIRTAAGSFDLEIKETILRIDRPLLFEAKHEPVGYLHYTPGERKIPIDVDDRDPMEVFHQIYGKNPVSWETKISFAPNKGGCDTTVWITFPSAKFGWIARRTWPRMAAKQLRKSLDRVELILADG